MTISFVIGERADVIKAASVLDELRRRQPEWVVRLIYSGHGGDEELPAALLEQLGVAAPDVCLGVARGAGIAQTTAIMLALQQDCDAARPDAMMVFGDSTATLAGALAGSQLGIPVAHVEAGLRSFDRRTPAEVTRVVADAVSQWLFTTEREADVNLRAEGLPDKKIHFVGSTAIDTLIRHRATATRLKTAETLGVIKPYVVAALAKPCNVAHEPQLRSIAYALLTLAEDFDVVYSLTPPVAERLQTFGLSEELASHRRLRLLPTTGYLEFISLLHDAAGVITDSSSVQEEAVVIGTPCVTLGRYTKHPVTLAHGGNRLAGGDPHLAIRYVREAIDGRSGYAPIPEGWDGQACARVVDAIERSLAERGSDGRLGQAVPTGDSDRRFRG